MVETERDYVESRKYVVEILKGFRTMDWESMTMPMTMDFGDTTSGRVDANLFKADDWFEARYMLYDEHLRIWVILDRFT